MSKIKQKKSRVKRKYNTDLINKIKEGEPWVFHFVVDEDVATKIIEQKELSTPGTQYQYLFNKFLREGLKEY